MRAAAIAKVREWQDKPGLFVREQFGAQPDAWQEEALEALTSNYRLALKACKGPGKSTFFAWAGWWFLSCFPHPKLVATSVTGDNLRDNLWTEYAKWLHRSAMLDDQFLWSAERIVAKQHPETWWASARAWPKSADATQQADALAGVHGDFVMFQLDESGGIPDAVMATAEAGLANADPAQGRKAWLLQAGNPTMTSGPLYRACTRDRPLWWVREITGDPDDPKRSPRVSLQWAREQIQKYGREHPYVLVNVMGQFPPQQSNVLIGVEDCTQAAQRTLSERDYLDEVKVLGVDVARFGDDRSTATLRQGRAAFRTKVWRNLDTMQLAGQVALLLDAHKPDATFIDQTGVGAGVVDRLKQLGYEVVGIDSSGRATRSEKYLNRRAEMWFETAEWLKAGGCIADDSELVAELTAPTYKFARDGRLQLEAKDDLKKRGLPSPDKADSLCLTFAAPVAHRELRAALGPRRKTVVEWEPYQES